MRCSAQSARSGRIRLLGVIAYAALLPACARGGAGGTRMPTPRATYEKSLRKSGLAESALGRDWSAAAERALTQATRVHLPFRESVYFSAEQPGAAAYRIELQQGQRLTARATVQSAQPGDVFIDVLEARAEDVRKARRAAEMRGHEPTLEFDVRAGGVYFLRIQPELLRGGRYTITLELHSAVLFPVLGKDQRAIIGKYGDNRDEGSRSHEGVDIGAARGTPALAAARGTVTAVQTTAIGGKVVWMHDELQNLSLYYAHLDKQIVSMGRHVQQGDTLGLVGNTGNAQGASPHLHFGVYVRGNETIDPERYLRAAATAFVPSPLDTALIGSWSRVARQDVRLRAAPEDGARIIAQLPRATALRVTGGTTGWYRVRMPDGEVGFVSAALLESAFEPVRIQRVAGTGDMLDFPRSDAAVIETLIGGSEVPVLAFYNGFIYTQSPSGHTGWINTGR
jgi:murein DD-endopeptidase MepM/ murein hydrolase activator NlpD/SH3-like domain-containing protein